MGLFHAWAESGRHSWFHADAARGSSGSARNNSPPPLDSSPPAWTPPPAVGASPSCLLSDTPTRRHWFVGALTSSQDAIEVVRGARAAPSESGPYLDLLRAEQAGVMSRACLKNTGGDDPLRAGDDPTRWHTDYCSTDADGLTETAGFHPTDPARGRYALRIFQSR